MENSVFGGYEEKAGVRVMFGVWGLEFGTRREFNFPLSCHPDEGGSEASDLIIIIKI